LLEVILQQYYFFLFNTDVIIILGFKFFISNGGFSEYFVIIFLKKYWLKVTVFKRAFEIVTRK
jgi:hypothetical protein